MIYVLISGALVQADNLTYTSVDPGGYETCSFSLESPSSLPLPGAEITIMDAGEVVWQGFVEEPGQRHSYGTEGANVTGVGAGILLKRNLYSMVYIDRDLTKWMGISRERQVTFALTRNPLNGPEVIPDATTGEPSLYLDLSGPYSGSSGAVCEAWYDSGPGNLIAGIQTEVDCQGTGGNATWDSRFGLDSDDLGVTDAENLVADNDAVDRSLDTYYANTPARFAWLLLHYGASTLTDARRGAYYKKLAVIGDHGLDLAPSLGGLDGVRCVDVARDAFLRSMCYFRVGKFDFSEFTIPHSTYVDLTEPEKVIADMAQFLGWHWGVWGGDMLDLTPRFYFVKPPTEETVFLRYEDCENLELSERLSEIYDSAAIQWTTATGQSGRVVVEAPNFRLDKPQTLVLQGGMMQEDEARAIAATYLNLQNLNKSAGQVTLPNSVVQAGTGVAKASHTLRPGLDRIRITGFPSTNSPIMGPPSRIDVFRIKRITVTVDAGVPRTQIEFDSGASLLETLTARLDLTQTLAGA